MPKQEPRETITRLAEYTSDPFDGYFDGHSPDELIAAQPLLDTPAVRRWFERFAEGVPESLYTYQLPLSRAAGPESSALGEDILMFSSYSYLGLIGHPRIAAAVQQAVERFGTSTGGVRLLTGTLELHLEVEQELASFLGQEAAACFGSGYDANLAAISALFGPDDHALLDQYAHQSIVDGVRMAGCINRRFRHNDMEDLERRIRQARNRGAQRILIAVDSVFSMDGDQAPLAELLELRDRYGAFLLVDEAHSIGAIGPTGRGICEEQGIDPARIDIVTGSLSKGIPSSGGFIAGSRALKIFMQHGSAPYIFSAALTPPNAAAVLEALRIIRDEPVPTPAADKVFGSDAIAAVLRALDLAYIALTPGASYRGLHDSFVNYLGNRTPQMILCLHDEHAVSIAQGYCKASDRMMAAALHSNVGLMHATMAVFNAWCDRRMLRRDLETLALGTAMISFSHRQATAASFCAYLANPGLRSKQSRATVAGLS